MGKYWPDKEWVASLGKGSRVVVRDSAREYYADTVSRITPTGRIVLARGDVFRPDGWARTSGVYANRFISKP